MGAREHAEAQLDPHPSSRLPVLRRSASVPLSFSHQYQNSKACERMVLRQNGGMFPSAVMRRQAERREKKYRDSMDMEAFPRGRTLGCPTVSVRNAELLLP